MWVEPFEELEELSRKVLVLIAVVVDGAVTGNYRYTTLKGVTADRCRYAVPDLLRPGCSSLSKQEFADMISGADQHSAAHRGPNPRSVIVRPRIRRAGYGC